MEKKEWFKSRTLWANALTIVIVGAAFFGITPNQELAESLTKILGLLLPILNIGLRFDTKQPIH